MGIRGIVLCALLLGTVAAQGGRLLEVNVAGDDGKVRTLSRAELVGQQLVATRTFLDALWYAETQEFARKRADAPKPKVVVFGGRGVFPPSLKGAVRRLDEAKIPCRVVFADTFEIPRGVVVVIPGGWAPSIAADIGLEKLVQLRTAKVLGICAGAYLLCEEVVWEGARFPYPVARVKGTAVGPLPNIAAWPSAAAVTLDTGVSAIYAGGAAFETEGTKVRARYPDGRAAIVAGKGVILSAVHCEMSAAKDADLLRAAGWPAAGDGQLFVQLVRELMR